MLYQVLYVIFLGVVCSMLVWGVLKKDRSFQYPTIAGIAWISFFALPVFVSVQNPSKYDPLVLDDGGLYIALIMLILCSGLGWLGYYMGINSQRMLFNFPQLNERKLFVVSLVLYLIGFYSAYKQAQLFGGFVAQFSGGHHYSITWEGPVVLFNYLKKLMDIGLAIALLVLFRKWSFLKLLIVILMLVYPVSTVMILGRRSATGILAVLLILSLMFSKRIFLPRPVFALLLLMIPLVIYYGPAYRTQASTNYDIQEISQSVGESKSIDETLAGGYSEFDVLVYYSAAAQDEFIFDYGLKFYNEIIRNFVPRQLVGETVKNALMVKSSDTSVQQVSLEKYHWLGSYGSFLTGPCDAFMQYSFLGALYYYLFGYLYAVLWKWAYIRNNVCAQIWYMLMLYCAFITVVASITLALSIFINLFIFMFVVVTFSKKRAYY